MIKDTMQLRPRYGEVDQMGYVYHGNYVAYCHQARTEMLRRLGIHDSFLEENNIMLPVISFQIDYKKPARYDQELTIETTVKEMPEVRFKFEFDVFDAKGTLLSHAKSTVVFVDATTRLPKAVPRFVEEALRQKFEKAIEV